MIQQPVPPPTAGRDVVLIVSDDIGYADFGFHGSKQAITPNLDALARQGVVFTRAYAGSPVCSPSRATILTGLAPTEILSANLKPYTDNPKGRLGPVTTSRWLPDMMRGNRYRTAGFGKWHLGEVTPPPVRGFEYFWGFSGGWAPMYGQHKDPNRKLKRWTIGSLQPSLSPSEGYLTHEIARRSCEWLDATQESPRFLYVAFNAAHTPVTAPQGSNRGSLRARYLQVVKEMDSAIGTILRRLPSEAIVIFTNDNGGATNNASSNAPLIGHKGTLSEGGTRVPMIVRWSSVYSPGRSNAVISHAEIYEMLTGVRMTREQPVSAYRGKVMVHR